MCLIINLGFLDSDTTSTNTQIRTDIGLLFPLARTKTSLEAWPTLYLGLLALDRLAFAFAL